jgi:MauM/NapG family ferredoxin protein
MRVANLRIGFQVVFVLLFLACLYLMAAPRVQGYVVSVFLEADPLVALTTMLSTGHLYHVGPSGLWLGIGLLVVTILIGRAFCGWVCPFGALHHFMHWLGFPRPAKKRLEGNRYRKLYTLKYWILGLTIGMAILGTLQIGLLDPIALLTRSLTDAVFPVVDVGLRAAGFQGIHPSATPAFSGAVLIGVLFAALLLLNFVIPRFFCRVLCPLGALLGLFSRFALFRIHRDPGTCNGCNLCSKGCEGAAEPEGTVRLSECMVCMNCVEDCPHGSIKYGFLPPRERAIEGTTVGARRAAMAGIGGLALAVLLRRAGGNLQESEERGFIRPPGSLPEEDFLARCIKCDACLAICPTNVLQPAGLEGGFEALWTPVLNMKNGYCDIGCTLCGRACPTGAIQRLTPAQRQGSEARPDEESGPVIIGTANHDRGRCLPWAMDIQCVVCEEVCPVSPKAIWSRKVDVVDRNGVTKRLQQPHVDATKCVGCGICEHECPLRGPAAVRVGSRIPTV